MGKSTDGTYYDDGGFPFDGVLVTIGGLVFTFEDFNPVAGSHFVQSNNVSGAPRGGRDIADVITAQCTAQFPSGASDADTPDRFTEVTIPYRGSPKIFIITEVGTPKKSGQETKCSIKLREKLN